MPATLEFCTELDARARLAPSRRVAVRELVLDPADVVRVRLHETLPIVRQVWSAGERVI